MFRWQRLLGYLLSLSVVLVVGCSSDGSDDPPGNDTRRTVGGLMVVNQDVATHNGDALGTPPALWEGSADGLTFDRSLAAADWRIVERPALHGSTGTDGQFTVGELAPGTYTLEVSKTLNGNLVSVSVPLIVGTSGPTEVVMAFGQGQLRTTLTYQENGGEVQDIRGPYGNRVVVRQGTVRLLEDGWRTLEDSNGDGRFESCRVPEGNCAAANLTGLIVQGATPIVHGQPAYVYAIAQFDDGSAIDVTTLAAWQSSAPTVAQVDSWGTVTTVATGTTNITATLGSESSTPLSLSVVERPPLVEIFVENFSCYISFLPGEGGGGVRPLLAEPATGLPDATDGNVAILPPPACHAVVQIGNALHFTAVGHFRNSNGSLDYYEEINQEVTWNVAPATLGDIVQGVFTGRQAGSGHITASLGGIASTAVEVRVVTEPTVVELVIYADRAQASVASSGVVDAALCFECGYTMTVLQGDQLHWQATALYDTGDWRDVSSEVSWSSSTASIASIDASGTMTAQAPGEATIRASLGEVNSQAIEVQVVAEATLQSIWIIPEGDDRVVEQGHQAHFRAFGYYDVGFDRDITAEVTWNSSNTASGTFTAAGVFSAGVPGNVEVWASLDGQESERIQLEVFAASSLDYCDAQQINSAEWSDAFNRVTLESDCAAYSGTGVVSLRYTVTEIQPRFGIFDPCLDLYVYRGDTRVRTLREEGCGEPFSPAAAVDAQERLRYQLLAFWDKKDEQGNLVAPGTYTIHGRFYLYYDPVVSLNITLR